MTGYYSALAFVLSRLQTNLPCKILEPCERFPLFRDGNSSTVHSSTVTEVPVTQLNCNQTFNLNFTLNNLIF